MQYGQPQNNAQYAPPQKPKRERKGMRTFALVLAGAVLGSVIGGGAMGLYLGGRTDNTTLSASAQSYINSAVAKGLKNSSTGVLPVSANTTGYSGVQSVAESVMPSVVGVRTVENVQGLWQNQQVEGVGTGIIVSSDGLILTNQHVVSGNPSSLTVTLIDGSEHDAQVLFSDATMDLAVIKIDATGLKAAKIGDSDSVAIGETAIAIGNPLGLNYQRSVTAGIVSALGRSILISQTKIAENLIQTDAAINSGNSGGPLLNSAGEVIGINSYKMQNGEGMGFAIPVNVVAPVIEQIINTGSFNEAKLGVQVIDKQLLNYYENSGITLDSGLYVYDVDAQSDANAQGLKAGNAITSVDGTQINTLFELKELLYSRQPGDTVSLKVLRSGSEINLNVKLMTA
jgi:serine protease Do